MIKLSIISVNYNNAEGLEKTIESVINQTSNEFEYIIIDGGSTDGSEDIIKKYENKINCWVSESDKGIYNAMNKGIKHAKGEYCQFLNSGDYLVNEYVIEKMLKNIHDDSYSIILGNMIKKLSNGKIIRNKGINSNDLTFLNFFRSTVNHSPAIIKRSLLEKYGLYDESLKIVSDWKFFLMSIGLNNEKVYYKDIDVSFFNADGISENNLALRRKERKEVLENVLPTNIYKDYELFSKYLTLILRIKKYKFAFFCIRVLNKIITIYERILPNSTLI